MKKICFASVSLLALSGALFLVGCGNDNPGEIECTPSVNQSKPVVETFENDTISVTLDTNKYAVETNKEFYKPSLRIIKSDEKHNEEYISVQQLKNENEKITLSDDEPYTNEKLKSEFQDYISDLTGFTPVEEERIGDKTLYKTTTAVNAVESNIYRTLTDGKNVYKIIVSGPNFKDTEEAKKLLEDIKLK
ncbi:MAG: hypothetical protein Q4D57_03030 [Clostridia bacterium]|nr:hypothetical protein [Clostridia bacterium]